MRGQLPFFCVFPVKFLRLSSDASHVRGGGLGETALPRGNSVLPRRFESLRLALAATLYQKSGLLTEISRRDISAAGLSGLSLPDAHYEHTSIRASTTNLTKNVNCVLSDFAGRVHLVKDFRQFIMQFNRKTLAYLV